MSDKSGASRQCGNCGFSDSGKFCSNCGSEMIRSNVGHRMAMFALGPISDWYVSFRLSLFPAELVSQLNSNEQTVEKCGKSILTGIALCGIIDTVIKTHSPDQFFTIPLIGEILNITIMGLVILLSTYNIHLALKKKSSEKSFNKFFKANATLTASFLPMSYLFERVFETLSLLLSIAYLYIVWKISILLYKVTKLNATIAIVKACFRMIIIISVIYAIAQYIDYNYLL